MSLFTCGLSLIENRHSLKRRAIQKLLEEMNR
jgi:hypothetical protein